MRLEETTVTNHAELYGGYRLLELRAPRIVPDVNPGQFAHLRVARRDDLLLRRPFSIYKAEGETLSILYKDVGKGTHAMTALRVGDEVSVMGPLGNGYPQAGKSGLTPVLVAGGYGMAALYLVASRAATRGVVFVGGASKVDILCVADFEAMGWEVRVATEDGSLGAKGLVTTILDCWCTGELGGRRPELFACGPLGMLRAVGDRAEERGWTAWLSMDRHMGCGVGACLACVQQMRLPDGGWKWARVCREGPVFECRDIRWGNDE